MTSLVSRLCCTGDFFTDSMEAFGGTAALPTHTPTATLDRVTTHLQDTTSDPSLENLRELITKASGSSDVSVQAIVNSILKYQGVKIGRGEGATGPMHGHGHITGGSADDLGECVQRIQGAVSSCLKKIGMEQSMTPTADRTTPRQSLMRRFIPGSSSSTSPDRGTSGGAKLQGMRQVLTGLGRRSSTGSALDDSILSFDMLGDATVALEDDGDLAIQAAGDDDSFPGKTPHFVRHRPHTVECPDDDTSAATAACTGAATSSMYAQED